MLPKEGGSAMGRAVTWVYYLPSLMHAFQSESHETCSAGCQEKRREEKKSEGGK